MIYKISYNKNVKNLFKNLFLTIMKYTFIKKLLFANR